MITRTNQNQATVPGFLSVQHGSIYQPLAGLARWLAGSTGLFAAAATLICVNRCRDELGRKYNTLCRTSIFSAATSTVTITHNVMSHNV